MPRYILQEGPTVNVARSADRNGNVSILTSGVEVVRASDYDLLAAQARKLATAVVGKDLCIVRPEYAATHAVTGCVKCMAQAVLDAEGRHP